MSFNPALVTIEDDANPPISLYFRIGGQPTLIVPMLTQALSVGRRGLDPPKFVTRICAAIGLRAIREVSLLLDPPEIPLRWTYDITLQKTPWITVREISDGGEPTVLYENHLDNYLTKALRKPSKRRGRLPAGYASQEEYLKSIEKPERHAALKEEVLRERAQSENPNVNLAGVKVYDKEEYFAQRRDAKRAKRDAKKERKNK